jgi:hypothetical protein
LLAKGDFKMTLFGFCPLMHFNIIEGMKGTLLLEEASVIALVRAGNADAFADIVERTV